MIGLIRKLLSKNRYAYALVAKVYHELRYFFQKCFYQIFQGVPVLRISDLDRTKYKSQFGQDFLIDTLFLPNTSGGFFVEIGANDPIRNSNTYYLEKYGGYSGLSFDAIDFCEGYKKHRPNTEFRNIVISSSEEEVVFNFVESQNGWEDQLSGIDSDKLSGKNLKIKQKKVPAARLEAFLSPKQKIDVMIIDVEGHEIEVMNSFDLEGLRPKLVICENSGPLKEHRNLQNFMSDRGYVLQARIWTADDVYVPNGTV